MRCAPTSTVASNSHTSSSGSLLTPPRLTVRNPFAGRGNKSMTVVPEARAAAAYGVRDAGVTAMHDATEGGVLGGLYEVAEASGVGLRINQSAIPYGQRWPPSAPPRGSTRTSRSPRAPWWRPYDPRTQKGC